MNGWRHFIYVIASASGSSALDMQVPGWAMPQIMIVTYDLWIEISAADAVLLRMAVSGFGVDEGDGTFGFDIGGRFKLDEFAGANYPNLRYRWIELCGVEVASKAAEAALSEALGARLLNRWLASSHECRPTEGFQRRTTVTSGGGAAITIQHCCT